MAAFATGDEVLHLHADGREMRPQLPWQPLKGSAFSKGTAHVSNSAAETSSPMQMACVALTPSEQHDPVEQSLPSAVHTKGAAAAVALAVALDCAHRTEYSLTSPRRKPVKTKF